MKYSIADLFMVNLKFFYHVFMILNIFAWACFYEFIVGIPTLSTPFGQFLNLSFAFICAEWYIKFDKVEKKQKEYFEKKRFKNWD